VSVEIANESGISVDEASIVSVARFTLSAMRVDPLAELSVLIVDAESMAELHERWMDLPGPTDVMAFPMDEMDGARRPDAVDPGPTLLGDVVLCPAFARDQARKAGHSLMDELYLLTVHGVLHLLGYDHAEPDEEREMFALQQKLLTAFRAERAAAQRKAAQRSADNRLLGAVGLHAEHTEHAQHTEHTEPDGRPDAGPVNGSVAGPSAAPDDPAGPGS
jgi:probable rRNA maturation factor